MSAGPVVIGVDPSQSYTGVALPDGRTTGWVPRPGAARTRGDHLALWQLRFATVLRRHQPAAVVYEDVLLSKFARAMIAAAELRSLALVAAEKVGVPIVLVHPSALKRFATGNGKADKEAMVAAAVAAGAAVLTDNEADAWHLRALGVLALGGLDLLAETQPDGGHRLEVVADLTWPKVGR